MNKLPEFNSKHLSPQTLEQMGQYWQSSKSENTWRAYQRHWKNFEQWCRARQLDEKTIAPAAVATFLTEAADAYSLSTLEQLLAALRFRFEQLEGSNPTQHLAVKRLMEGIRRQKGRLQKQSPALRIEKLEKVCAELAEIKVLTALRNRTLLLLGYFGAFRRSELVRLNRNDIHESSRGFTVMVRKSKTDQQGKGMLKAMPFRTNTTACPAATLKEYLENIPDTEDTPLFSAINRWGQLSEKRMTDKSVDLIVKKYFGKEYSAHSLRAGFITDARKRGASDAAITAQTGQKAVTLERYTRFEDVWEMNAALDF